MRLHIFTPGNNRWLLLWWEVKLRHQTDSLWPPEASQVTPSYSNEIKSNECKQILDETQTEWGKKKNLTGAE